MKNGMRPIIEVCSYNYQSAENAKNAGADRIELCDNIYQGGTTPSHGLIAQLRQKFDIDINVMIRPRGGDFYYDDFEFDVMKHDILMCNQIGADGVVFGILKPDGSIDLERTSELKDIAGNMSVSFHRAFDMSADLFSSLDDLLSIGIDRVLTSGGFNTVWEGRDVIKELVTKSNGNIVIMPGSGINFENIRYLKEFTGANEFHLSAKMPVESKMQFRKQNIMMNSLKEIPEYEIMISDAEHIKKSIQALS
jgi:copper homeostasis protein